MRISLVERETQDTKRRKPLKQRRRRTFDSAITRPQTLPRAANKKKRAPSKTAAKRRSRPRQPGAPVASAVPVANWWRNALGRLLGIAGMLGAISVLAYGSVDASFFVYRAEVTGADHIDAAAIYRQSGVHERNIFWVRPQQVAERISQLDGVRAARVRTGLPAWVSIEVQEREPVVMWRCLAQQRDWWLDSEGRVLPYPGDAQSPQMLFVVDSSDRQLELGATLQPAGLVRSVQQLAAAVSGTRIFYYDGDRQLSFTQQVEGSQWPVYVGTSDDLPRKIQVLQVLDRYLRDNGIHPRYVDVRWPDHPLYNVPAEEKDGESE